MENDENSMINDSLMANEKAIRYTTNLTPPSFEPVIGEDGKPTGEQQRTSETRLRDQARSKASVELLFRTDLSRLDDAGVKGLYESVTEGVWGIPDTTGRFFGKRGSSTDFRHNLDLLRSFFKGEYRLAEDPEAEKFRKMSWEEKFHYALEHEPTAEKVKSYMKGERGAGFVETLAAGLTYSGVGLPPGAMATARQVTGNKKIQDDANELWREMARRSNYFALNDEEKKEYESDVISDYERRMTKKEPLYTYLQMAANLSDEAAYILAKSYNNDTLDVQALMGLSDDERRKVMTTFAQMRGDLTKGHILGIETDFDTGTTGDRFQMGLYGLQQSVISLATDLYGLARDGAIWSYAKMAMDEQERKDFFRAWTIESEAKRYEEKQLPDAESGWGEAYQAFMENAHWIIPYGGAAKISKAKAVSKAATARKEIAAIPKIAEIAATRKEAKAAMEAYRIFPNGDTLKFADESINKLFTTVDKYTRELQELERMRLSTSLGAGAMDAAWIAARGSAYASFAEEYIEAADAAGISREESVLTGAIIGLINDRIEQLYVPGLESTLTKAQLKSIGWNAFRTSLQEGTVGTYAANLMKRWITEGARVGVTEGWVEEPLQQIVLEHGKRIDQVEGLDNKMKAALKITPEDLKTYIETGIDMIPASMAFGVTTLPGQGMRRRIRNMAGARQTGLKNYDEGIIGLWQQEIDAQKLLKDAWSGKPIEGNEPEEGEEKKPKTEDERNEEEVKVLDAFTKAREIHDSDEKDPVGAIAKELQVDVKVAEAIEQLMCEEDEAMMFDPRVRSMIDTFFQGVRLNEETINSILPGYVPGSFEADEENGVYVAKVKIAATKDNEGLKPGVKTIVYRRRDSAFARPDGTLDEEALAAVMADPNYAVSYNRRVMAEGHKEPLWEELSDAEKRRKVLDMNGRQSGMGTVAFRKKDGSEVVVRADAIIDLATGRLADVGYGFAANQATVRHETFHALWQFASEIVSDEEKKKLCEALGIEQNEGWETELDEAMAHQFEEYASGHYVLNAMSSRFESFQAWAANVFGAKDVNAVLDVSEEKRGDKRTRYMSDGTPYALKSFYDSILQGKLGTGELGIDKIVIPAKPEVKVAEANDELPVEGDNEEVKVEGQGEQRNDTPSSTPTATPTPSASTMERPEWDKGTTVIKRVPKKNYKIHAKLEVVNIHDGIRTSWSEGFDQENQGRDITSDDSKSLVEEIAGDPDYSKGGRVMEFTGSGAPLVSPSGDVLDGNHHMHGLQLAYERGGEKVEKFKEQCLQEAKARGLEISEHAAEAPIIICRIESVEVKEGETVPTVAQIAEDTNDTVQRGLNIFETAAKDARILIQHNLIPRFEIDPETGYIKDEEDKKANGQIVNPIGIFRQQSRAQGLVDESNHITEDGQKRLMNAILAALLGGTNPKVVQAIMEKTKHLDMDNEMRALMRMTPRLLALVNDPAKKDYDLRPEILEALAWYQEWRNKDEEERAKAGKNKTDWRKHNTRPTTWVNYKGDMFARPSEAAAILGDLFAAAQAERSFQADGETDTKAGSKRAQDLIIKELSSYLDNVYATNTDTADMFGDFTPPSKAEILSVQRNKNGRYSIALYHGTGANFERPDLSHLGEGTGYAAEGHGFYTTDKRSYAEFWRDITHNYSGLWDSILGRGYVYQLDYDGNELDLCEWYGYNVEAAERLYTVAKEAGLEVREDFFDGQLKRTTGEKMELFLSMAKKSDGTRLSHGEMRELFIKAGIDGMREDLGKDFNNVYVFYNTDKLKVVHKWRGNKQLYSVGARRPSAADSLYREIRYSIKAGTKPYTVEELDKALALSGTERPNFYTKWILPDGRTPAGKAGHDFFNDEIKKVTESRGFFGMMGAGAIAFSDGSVIIAGRPTEAQFEALETIYRNYKTDRVDYDLYYSKYNWMNLCISRYERIADEAERRAAFASDRLDDEGEVDYTISINDEKFDEILTLTYHSTDEMLENALKDLRSYYDEGVIPKAAQPARSVYSVGSGEKIRAIEYLHSAYPVREAARIEGNMERLKGTPWHDQVVKSLLIRQDIVSLMNGRELTPNSILASDKFKNVRTYLKRGKEGLFQYIRKFSPIGSAAKPVNNVNSTYIDCEPSEECAKYCYALTGNYTYQNPMVKGELVSLAAELDPKRMAEMIIAEYRTTAEYDAGKALRMFDKGDIAECWVEVIKEMNKAQIHAQVFSKRPEILRKLDPKMNQVMLSIDRSNRELALDNPDLPIAYVFSGAEGDVEFLEAEHGRFETKGGVILPLTNRAGKLPSDVLTSIPDWARPYVCPISSGVKKIGEWNCTKCDMKTGTGMGCFFHRTSALFNKLNHEPLNERNKNELEDLIGEIRREYESFAGEDERRRLLGWLAERLSEVRSGHVKGAEDGEDSLDAENGTGARYAGSRGRVRLYQKASEKEYPDASEELRHIPEGGAHYSLGVNRRAQYRELISKHRPEFAPEDVENILDTIGDYNSPKKEKLAVHWTITGAITLPEDGYKLDKAIETAKRAKVDPFHYKNPEDIFASFPQYLPKEKPIDPASVPELRNPTDMGRGIIVYDVDESEKKLVQVDGMMRDVPLVQLAMRRIINTHWGKDASPWCLLQGNGDGELSSNALHYWEHYSRLQKRVAFKDGRLLSFMGTDGMNAGFDPDYQRRWESFFAEYQDMYDNSETDLSPLEWMERHFPDVELPKMPIAEEWWDRQDKRHNGIPIEGKIENDPLGRWGTQEIMGDKSAVAVGKRWRGSQLDGLYEEWNENDVQVEHINRKKGKLHGKVTRWYNTGAVREEGEYKDDLPVGDHRTYDTGGRLASVDHYDENGFRDKPSKYYYLGELSSYTEYFGRNQTKRAVRYYGDGRSQMFIEYEQPHHPGLEVSFNPRGLATRLSFQSGENRVQMGYRREGEVERLRIDRKDGTFIVILAHDENKVGEFAEHDSHGRKIAGGVWSVDGLMTAAYAEGHHYTINPWNGVMTDLSERGRRLTDEEKAKIKVANQPTIKELGEKYPEISQALIDAEDELLHAELTATDIYEKDREERNVSPKYSVRLHRAKRDSILRPKSAIAQMELELFTERKEVKGKRVQTAVEDADKYQKFIDKYRPLYQAAIDTGDWNPVMNMAEKEGMPAASNVLKRYFREPTFDADLVGQKISGVEDVAAILMAVRSPFVESTKAIYLDRHRQILDAAILSVGQPGQASIARGELTRRMPPKTAYVVFSHNHPSGDPHPSNPDKALTMALKQELKAVGVKMLDHIITDGDRYYSFNYQDIQSVDTATPKWETIPAGKKLGTSFTRVDQVTSYIAAHLRDDGMNGHLIYMNAQNQITGVKRIPELPMDLGELPEYVRKIALGSESVGGKRVVIDLGRTYLPDGAKRREVFQLLGPRFGQHGIDILDIVSDAPGGGVLSYHAETSEWDKAVPASEPPTNVERFNYPRYSIASRKVDWEALPSSLDRVILSTTVAHLTGQDKFPEKYVYFKLMFRNPGHLEEGRKMVEEWAEKRETKWLGTYLLAKYYGDLDAAKAIVKHHVRHNKVSAISQFLKRGTDKDFLEVAEADEGKPIRWLYVRNNDGMVTNRIPEAYAIMLAEKFGGSVDRSIVKVSDERNTGATIKARVGREFQFEGETDGKSMYIIVDDVWTTGQTAVSLMEYLQHKGADVRAITTLAVASNGSRIKPTGRLIADLMRKAHVSSLEEAEAFTGIDFSQATGSELQAYVVKGSKGVMGLESWFGSAAPTLGLDFSKEAKKSKGEEADLFKHLDPSGRKLKTKPMQGVFHFSTAFPRLSDLGDDQLIAAALASRLALDKKENMTKALRFDTVEKLVKKAFPLLEGEQLRTKTLGVQGDALKFARKIREGLDKGVSESAILKALNDTMKPVFERGMQKQGRMGAKIGAYGANAEAMLDARSERIFNEAIRVQTGVDSDSFEAWAGVDLAETLWKVLENEKANWRPAPKLPEEEGAEDAESSGGGVEIQGKKYDVKELENPRSFAEMIRDLAAKYWREKHGLGMNANPWTNRIAVQFLRKTAQNIYTNLVNTLTYSRSRDTANRAILKLENIPTVDGVVSQMAFIGEIIHARHIRESKQELCEKLENLLKLGFGATGRFKPDKEELRRKVSAEMELRARYMRHAMWLTPEAASEEAGELSRQLTEQSLDYASAERDLEQSRIYVETIRKLNILREFGALKYKTLGEIEAALQYWEDLASGSRDKILAAFDEREARTKTAAAVLARAFFNPKRKHIVDKGFGQALNNYLSAHMGFATLLQDMMRFADDKTRADAEPVVEYLMREIQKAGDRSAAEMRRHGNEFHQAVENIYAKSFKRVMADMNREAPEFEPFMGTKGGVKVTPTKARAMQLLVSLRQGAKKGSNYYENVKKWKREGQADRIAALLSPQDLNMVKWIGQWYESNRQELSAVCENLFGIGVYSEAANYFPVKMLLQRQGLEKVEGVAWTIFPKALTPRIRNERDFDTEADIFSMWASRMEEASQWKGHAKLGLELRGIFGRSELQEVVAANHGKKVNGLMLGFITDILAGHGAYDRTTGGIEYWSDKIRGWTALCALGGNIGVTLKQTTSIPAFGFELGAIKTARFVFSAFTPDGFAAMKKIFSSEQRLTRWQVGNTEAVKNALARDDAGWFKRALQASMITNKIGDVVPALVVGQGIYRDAIARGMSEENAMAQTWMLIERTQQSGRMENQTSVQRRNRLGRMLYQFLTTQQQYLQYEIKAIRQMVADPSLENAGKLTNTLLLNHLILTSLYWGMGELYKAMLGAEPPKDRLADWAVNCLLGPYASLYVLGFCSKTTLNRFLKGSWSAAKDDMLPMEGFIKRTIGDSARVLEAIFDEEKSTDELIDELADLVSGLNPVVRDVRKVIKNADGE